MELELDTISSLMATVRELREMGASYIKINHFEVRFDPAAQMVSQMEALLKAQEQEVATGQRPQPPRGDSIYDADDFPGGPIRDRRTPSEE